MCKIQQRLVVLLFLQDVPEGSEDALKGLTFVISGVLDRQGPS